MEKVIKLKSFEDIISITYGIDIEGERIMVKLVTSLFNNEYRYSGYKFNQYIHEPYEILHKILHLKDMGMVLSTLQNEDACIKKLSNHIVKEGFGKIKRDESLLIGKIRSNGQQWI